MAYPTTDVTIYPSKSPATQGDSQSAWEFPDGNIVRAAILAIASKSILVKTQNVNLDSTGTTTFTPTYAATPYNVCATGRNASANTMIDASMTATVLTATGITIKHGTSSADRSCRMTVFYA